MKECWLPALVTKSNKTISDWIENVFNVKTSKNFLHFDVAKKFESSQDTTKFFEGFLSKKNIANHNFFPLIRYIISENKVKLEDNEEFFRTTKERPITYASHLDSCIYSYYSFILQGHYEKLLYKHNLDSSILAYRVVENNEWKWKNNIDFAKDTFSDISNLQDCYVIALDVRKFFDTLDHPVLKHNLQKTLGLKKLNDDWYKVFRSLTKFSYIKKETLWKFNLIKKVWQYKKIVDLDRFNTLRQEGKKKWERIVEENTKNKWIPQWTAISWMLANLYMIEFDIWINDYIKKLWGKYYRYSDDLLLIIPLNKDNTTQKCETLIKDIHHKIDTQLLLKINDKKTEICLFKEWTATKEPLEIAWVKTQNSIQYLGFDFDGSRVLIRNKTLSNFYKKMIHNIKRLSHLNDLWNDDKPHYKWDKILTGKLNRKFLYNGKKSWWRYVIDEEVSRWKIDDTSKSYYLWFISYWYTAYDAFEIFCKEFNIKNGIKKQLAGHRNIYKKHLEKYDII